MTAPSLERCVITITDGTATAVYRWSDCDRDGHDTHDEDVSTWTDEEIRDCFRHLIGIDAADSEPIEVVWN